MNKPWHPKTPVSLARERANRQAKALEIGLTAIANEAAKKAAELMAGLEVDWSDFHKDLSARFGTDKDYQQALAISIRDALIDAPKQPDEEQAAQDALDMEVREPEEME